MKEKATQKKQFNFGQFYGKYGIFIILVVIFAAASLAVPGFFSKYNLTNVLLAITCTTVLALGATFVIILGHINIAYGSELAFIGCIACLVNVATGSVWLAILVALGIGLVLGTLTGLVITKFSIPAFIVTLAITEAARGGTGRRGAGHRRKHGLRTYGILPLSGAGLCRTDPHGGHRSGDLLCSDVGHSE